MSSIFINIIKILKIEIVKVEIQNLFLNLSLKTYICLLLIKNLPLKKS